MRKFMKNKTFCLILAAAMVFSLFPTATFAEPTGGADSASVSLDLSNGSIVITDSGYKQGKIEYGAGTKYGSAFSIKNATDEEVSETAFTGSYIITQSGDKTDNGIRIEGLSEDKTVTLSGIKIEKPVTGSGVVIWKNARVKLLLDGENSISGIDSNPAICVANGAVLTIDNAQASGTGKLKARGHSNSAGIGATNRNYSITGDGADYGSIIVNGGYIDTQGGNNAVASGIGSGWSSAATKVTINGGTVYVPGGGCGICAKETVITGGTLHYVGKAADAVKKFSTAAGNKEPVVSGGSLVNANETYGTGAAEYRRVVIAFGDKEMQKPLKNTEITVCPENNAEGASWKAFTDESGILYAYLPSNADKVSVRIPGETETRTLALTENGMTNKTILSEIKCICEEHNGALTMNTKSQTVTAVKGKAELTLDSIYMPTSCELPKGYGFHGEYEAEPEYEIVSIVRNGRFMTANRYASIMGNKVTVYADADKEPYTVSIRALVGPKSAKVYSDPIEILVKTYTYESQALEGELDIGNGSILITDTGYSQGVISFTQGSGFSVKDEIGNPVTETAWAADNTAHALTVTGSNGGLTKDHIVVLGGNPVITLKNVNIEVTDGAPGIGIVSGKSETEKNTAAVVLEGNNTITGASGWPGILINQHSVLTIEGEGILNATGRGAYSPGIGSCNIGSSRFAINRENNRFDNNKRAGGEIIIKNGTINAASGGGTAALGSANDNTQMYVGKITIEGGIVTTKNLNNQRGIFAKDIVIKGGQIHAEALDSRWSTRGIEAKPGGFEMSGGTITMGKTTGTTAINGNTSVNITGGNINTYYSGTISGRALTKLYFVKPDGSPLSNINVTINNDGNGNEWHARTNEEGIITTYFADATDKITLSYVTDIANNNVSASLKNGQALIGGVCTCAENSTLEWGHGLPAKVTLYGKESVLYNVTEAKLMTDKDCHMPIHPNLPTLSYNLSVIKDGSEVYETAEYATYEGGVLTLKEEKAPYQVKLIAMAGDKTEEALVSVVKGTTAEGQTVIDLSKGDVVITAKNGGYIYTQNSGEVTAGSDILLTGNAADAKVSVDADGLTLSVAQDAPGNVYTVYAGENCSLVKLNPQNVKGKLRFGGAGDALTVLGYVTDGKVKLNPDRGDISFGMGSVTQDEIMVMGIDEKEMSVIGASTEQMRYVKNESGAELTIKINGKSVMIADNEGMSIDKAIRSNESATTKTYLMAGGPKIYQNYMMNDGITTFYRCSSEKSDEYMSEMVDGYRLIAVGEGDAQTDRFKEVNTESENYMADVTQSRITEAVFDEDFTGKLIGGNILYAVNLKELHAEQFSDMSTYFAHYGELYFGENLKKFSWGNYAATTGVHIPDTNPYFALDGGALYTKDYSTLLLIPSGLTKPYTVREECTRMNANGLMYCSLSSITIGENVNYIGDTYKFFQNHVGEFRVEGGNKHFAVEDGVLYTSDFKSLLAYPGGNERETFTVPKTLTHVDSFALDSAPIKTLVVPKEAEISSMSNGFARMYELESVVLRGNYAGGFENNRNMKSLQVPDGFNFEQNLNTCSMSWIRDAGISVSGGESIAYDGKEHSVVVKTTDDSTEVEYSSDSLSFSEEEAPAFKLPGEYKVYWRITKAADETYDFDRVLSGSTSFTISELQASENWFVLTPVKDENVENPVTLSQPEAAPSLKDGYTVKYKKAGGEAAMTEVPNEEGIYLVTVDIFAEGYAKKTMKLGYYTVPAANLVDSQYILSFITDGGSVVNPIVAAGGSEIAKPEDPVKNGYTFGGWYSDSELRTKVENFPTSVSSNMTYYAKWLRNTYNIDYSLDGGINAAENPVSYTVESASFDLAAPQKPGYWFKGWTWEGQNEPQTKVSVEHGSYGEKAYTANWVMNIYDIRYRQVFDLVDENPTTYTVKDTADKGISLIAPPEREGYVFAGWTMERDRVVSILPVRNAQIPQGTLGEIVLTGIWMIQEQSLTLDANGGKFEDGSVSITIKADYAADIALTAPTRTGGYSFAGWYTDRELTMPFTATQMPLSSTLYAKWNKKKKGSSGGNSESVVPMDKVENPFIDVDAQDYFYDAVMWAIEQGITLGTDAVHFSPDGRCSRAEIVTFLWRVAGSPEPKAESGFADVMADSYYAQAVAWAVENGITTGMKENEFCPDVVCSRAQAVTFIARALNGNSEIMSGFPDVPDDSYYANAVAWAKFSEIARGIGDNLFAPHFDCTRAQIITFLHRAYADK